MSETSSREPPTREAWTPGTGDGPSPLGQLTLIRFREFLREPEAVFWTFIFPLLLAGGLGLAFRSRPSDLVKIGVLRSAPAAGMISSALGGDSTIQMVSLDDTAAVTALRIGTVALVVVAIDSERVEYRYDRARTEARAARLFVDQALQRARGRTDAVAVTESLISERGSRYIDFVLPGLLAMNLMGSGMWGIGFSIVDARRKKLLKRFIATPMRRYHYLMSFLVMRLGLMVIEVTVIVTFGYFAFGVPMRGSLVAFAVACLLGALVFGSLGLLVASRAKTIEAASGLMNLLMLPMWVASGVFFSAANFPDAVQPVIQALPLTAVVDSVRGIMIQGLGWSQLAPEFAIVGTWLVLSFTIALRFFRWR
jgi:ABC-type multidrug transport system permease subunit